MKKPIHYAVCVIDDNGHILVHDVKAFSPWNAFRTAANIIIHDFEVVFAMPWYLYKRSKIEFPGGGLVSKETILDPEQADVFPPDRIFERRRKR